LATIRPFDGQLVTDAFARDVPTPAHDAMTGQQRRMHVGAHAHTYLRVERTVGDGVTDTADAELVLREGRAALEELLSVGAFEPTGRSLYLYRLETEGHCQTGVVAELDSTDVVAGRVKPHEAVSTDKAQHLAAHFDVVGAQSSPILLGVRDRAGLAEVLTELTCREPDRVVDAGDGVRQTVWVVADDAEVDRLTAAVRNEDLYVIDGHHRVAATALHHGAHPDDPAARWTLAVIYPTAELQVHEYNRIVSDLGARSSSEILDALREIGDLTPCEQGDDPRPRHSGQLGVHVDGMWWTLELPRADEADVVARLDPTRFENEILPIAFGIPPDDPLGQVAHVGPNTTAGQLAAKADRLGGCAVLMHPLAIDHILDVADAGRFLPRKSTYFAPKARSGIFLRQQPS